MRTYCTLLYLQKPRWFAAVLAHLISSEIEEAAACVSPQRCRFSFSHCEYLRS